MPAVAPAVAARIARSSSSLLALTLAQPWATLLATREQMDPCVPVPPPSVPVMLAFAVALDGDEMLSDTRWAEPAYSRLKGCGYDVGAPLPSACVLFTATVFGFTPVSLGRTFPGDPSPTEATFWRDQLSASGSTLGYVWHLSRIERFRQPVPLATVPPGIWEWQFAAPAAPRPRR